MRVYLNHTREVALCKELKADELRVWAGLLSMVEEDLEVPPKAMISKRCLVPTAVVSKSLKALVFNGFLMDDMTVNPRYLSFNSTGKGSAPFSQNSLRDFSRNRTLHAEGLRLFYYLLGDIRLKNLVLDANISVIAVAMGSDRSHASRLVSQLKNEGLMEEHRNEKKYFVISPSVLGATKRR